MVLVMSYARKWLERSLYQKKKHIVESLVEFQDMAASILNKKELYQEVSFNRSYIILRNNS